MRTGKERRPFKLRYIFLTSLLLIPFVVSASFTIASKPYVPRIKTDGYRWDKEIVCRNERSNIDDEIVSLTRLDGERLLLSASGLSGAYIYDGSCWCFDYNLSDVYEAVPLPSGHIWTLSEYASHRELGYFDGDDWAFKDLRGRYDTRMCALDNEHAWLATSETIGDEMILAGALYSFDGDIFTKQLEVEGGIDDIAASSAEDVWAVCGRDVYHSRGDSWEVSFSSDQPLRRLVVVDAEHVWAVADGKEGRGAIYFYDGSSWNKQWEAECIIADLCAVDSGHAWALVNPKDNSGENEGYIIFREGSSWKTQCRFEGIFSSFSALDAEHVWAGGSGGSVFFWDGSSWTMSYIGTMEMVTAIAVMDNGDVRAAAADTLYRRIRASEPFIEPNSNVKKPGYGYAEAGDPGAEPTEFPALVDSTPYPGIGNSTIAYVRGDNIWIAAFDGSWEYRLTDEPEDGGYPSGDEIGSINRDSPYWQYLRFSPTGAKLAAWREEDLVVIDMQTSGQDVLTDRLHGSWEKRGLYPLGGDLCWLDEETIVCTAGRSVNGTKTANIVSLNTDTGEMGILVEFATSPSLSADGRRLACIRNEPYRQEGMEEYIILADSGDLVEKDLTTGEEQSYGGWVTDFEFAPLGIAHAYVTRGAPDEYIFYMDPENDIFDAIACCGPSGHYSGLCFSPDGTRLMYCGGHYEEEDGRYYEVTSIYYFDLYEPRNGGYCVPVKWGDGKYPSWAR